ncbi:hypothetical protein PTW35_18160 (plasmid) [Photobacterium sp. DA100]|uniref:hypothetical protein n=1 Tax=Photobacterium sp. DA100 TaxID=3027472 RepID=UPI00247ADF78|nr:hypothetical protein [Photobacterium sp. DA100]WEM45021.1 hypothetical protein PTW35_18160 [Photobacterium sp. DA100]
MHADIPTPIIALAILAQTPARPKQLHGLSPSDQLGVSNTHKKPAHPDDNQE